MTTDQNTTETDQRADRPIDMDVLMAFVGQVVGDLGATIAAGNVLVGEKLGLYRALAEGPTDARGLAGRDGHRPALRRGVAARAGRRWLRGVRRRDRRTR